MPPAELPNCELLRPSPGPTPVVVARGPGTEHSNQGAVPADPPALDPFAERLLTLDAAAPLTPQALLTVLAPPPPYFYARLKLAYGFDGQKYTEAEMLQYYGPEHGPATWDLACRVTHDVNRAVIGLGYLNAHLGDVARLHATAAAVAEAVHSILLDPSLPDTPIEDRLRGLLLQPLWIRREALESRGHVGLSLPATLSDDEFMQTWTAWQRSWAAAALTPQQARQPANKRRSYFFAAVKRSCGNPVWVKSVIKHGVHHIHHLLLTLMAVREDAGADHPTNLWQNVDDRYTARVAAAAAAP